MDNLAVLPDGPAFVAMPPPSPLAMDAQPLDRSPASDRRVTVGARRWRRLPVIGGAIALTAFAAREMYRVLEVGGLTVLECLILGLYVALFAWIALAATSAVAGFVSLMREPKPGPAGMPTVPTALLMPTYNEPPARVMAALEAMRTSLAARGVEQWFDIFVLSDTTDPDVWIAEEAAWMALRSRLPADARLFYRRRPRNTERKAGNIAEWVRAHGAAYPQMLILDADSVMTAELLVRLSVAMAADPAVGLLQSLPVVVGADTLFARMQQFAGRVYGPLIAHGIAWWHGTEGNYWGHNAIIRTAAFAHDAGLPTLHGGAPFGGHILSHDFVEAALLRRAGWQVRMLPGLAGSYEEGPPSLTELAVRDRRWCQGNLQHMAVLPTRGLHWVSRLHLLMGIGSYVTAPMWLVFLMAGIAVSLQARFIPVEYFGSGPTLFPVWPAVDPVRSMWLFVATMGVLLLPKVLAYVVLLTDPALRRGCGGAGPALLSILVETVLAGLLAPTTMLMQSWAVYGILRGREGGWNTQRRDGGAVVWADVTRAYGSYMVFGLVLGAAAFAVSPSLLAWMSPVVLGWALVLPLAGLTASVAAGRALLRLGLLRTPEEGSPPPEVAHAAALRSGARAVVADAPGLLAADPALLAQHMATLPPPRQKGEPFDPALLLARAKLAEDEGAWATMTRPERLASLADAEALGALTAGHRRIR